MRPSRIEMIGFGAFKDLTTVDFTDLDLVALVGPTGSGKSTIIDAVTFALFGSVARYDDRKVVAPVVHQLANGAKVRLDFELGGDRYTAVREVKRTDKGATTREARLQRGDEVLASGAREMDPAVVALLGLDFEQFTRTVVLPQGDFAELLHDSPADRQKLLRRLLDLGVYDQVGQKARSQGKEAATKASVHREQIAHQEAAGVTSDRLAELVGRADELAALHADLGEHIVELAEVEARAAEARSVVDELVAARTTLAGVQVPPDVSRVAGLLADARMAAEQAAGALKAARAERDLARTALAEGPDRAHVQGLLDAHAAEAAQREKLTAAADRASSATAAVAEAQKVADAATEALERARRTAAAARDAATAAEMVALLRAGEPCPLCRQVVDHVPDHDVDSELAAATAAEGDASSATDRATKALRKAEQEHGRAVAQHEALQHGLDDLTARLADSPGVDALTADLARAGELAVAAAEADAAVDAAEAALDAARATVDEHHEREQHLRRSFGTLRDAVVAHGPPEPGGDDLHADWTALADWASTTIEALGERLTAAEDTARQASTARDRVADEIERRTSSAGVDVAGVPTERLGERLATVAAAARHEADEMARRLEALEEQRATVAALDEQAAVADELGRLLRANRFEAWLLEGALDDLLAGASDRLRTLSSGQFSLERDGTDLRVRDHRNADELRNVKTLSGGETFLASLALALSLAERIGSLAHAGAPRIEAMFLDEGFGTLDPETLDVVATGLEELGAAGHMVGVVTHIRDLAERMPARIEVRKGPTTSTVERTLH